MTKIYAAVGSAPGIFALNGAAPNELTGYNKTLSIFHVIQLGLPTQFGIVVTAWNEKISKCVLHFLESSTWEQVLIRTDKKDETGKYMRGGYLVSRTEVIPEVLSILAKGRIVLLLEPANKYTNLYGINTLIKIGTDDALLEIVGPGFDVSDINRGDISPHERIQLCVQDGELTGRVLNRVTIDQTKYKETVALRLEKIGKGLLSKRGDNLDHWTPSQLQSIAEKHLRSTGFTLLLDSRNSYRPFPKPYLQDLVSLARDIPWKISATTKEIECVIACSVVGTWDDYHFIFWDIVYPTKKYNVSNLSEPRLEHIGNRRHGIVASALKRTLGD